MFTQAYYSPPLTAHPDPSHTLGSLLLQSKGFFVPLIKQTLEMLCLSGVVKLTHPLLELQLGAISYLFACKLIKSPLCLALSLQIYSRFR